MSQLSKEEVRAARLKALGINVTTNAPAVSSPVKGKGPVQTAPITPSKTTPVQSQKALIEKINMRDIWKLIYLGGSAMDEDLIRWNNEGFRFNQHPNFGLHQSHGGPCSILAVAQAEIIKIIFFDSSNSITIDAAQNLDVSIIESTMTIALSNILHRISSCDKKSATKLVTFSSPPSFDLPPHLWSDETFEITSYDNYDKLHTAVQQNLRHFQQNGGCILFLLSAILTRGVEKVLTDMDDPTSKLIGQFGHCNQEVINLLLTGRGTSNTFDGDIPLGESSMFVKGIHAQSEIGYLSHMEAMRYCQVGNYLKVPKFPIWVIGSSSHFTVLFSLSNEVNEESKEEKLFSTLQRCFKSIDKDECGFIASSQLAEALKLINIHHEYTHNPIISMLANEIALARLRGHLQIDGDIILWTSFWVNLSKLMTGQDTLDTLIQSGVSSVTTTNPAASSSSSSSSSSSFQTRMRSDSEIARELQAEFDGTSSTSAAAVATTSSLTGTPNKVARTVGTSYPTTELMTGSGDGGRRPRSDSEIARELQAQFDSEYSFPAASSSSSSSSSSFAPNNNHLHHSTDMIIASSSTPIRTSSIISTDMNVVPPSSSEDEKTPEISSILYHYNGLQTVMHTGNLTTLQLFRKLNTNIIGQPVALASGENANIYSSTNRPIEEVLRTRWQGCRVTWDGSVPPSID